MQYRRGVVRCSMRGVQASGIGVTQRVMCDREPKRTVSLALVTTYKNLAAMDDLQDKMEAIQEKMFGNQEARDAATIARGKMRTAVGSEVIRKIEFK